MDKTETIFYTEQSATSALLNQSETDHTNYQKMYEKLSSNSKSLQKSRLYECLMKTQSNRITPFQQQQQLQSKLSQEKRERNHCKSSYLLEDSYQFWKDKQRTKPYKLYEKASKQKRQAVLQTNQTKQASRKDMKISKVFINRVSFSDIFPRQNCFYSKKIGKQLHNKPRGKFHSTHTKVCANQKINSSQSNETFTMEIKKITKPNARVPSHSLPLKIEGKIEEFIVQSSKKIKLSYENQGKFIHQEYRHKFKHKKHRSDTFLTALSRPKISQDHIAQSDINIQSIQNRFNLVNIFRKLKQLRSADLIETEKRKQSSSSQEKQANLTKIEHIFNDKAIYSEKASQKYKSMKNGFKLYTQNARPAKDLKILQVELPDKKMLSQIYFNNQFQSS